MTARHLYTNRLAREKSPYLLQHSHNPVDWYPWGNEAFDEAKKRNKPIFLSIGYATCHWCHTMEQESFEDPRVAERMNEAFINIKVDREEMPEVDNLYMEFAQTMMAGSAGWPLNLVLTPELKPFFAATYLPPASRGGMMGLMELIEKIDEVWSSEEKEKLLNQADRIIRLFEDNLHLKGDQVPDPQNIKKSAELLFHIADPIYGGIRGAPKFPVGYQYEFLLRYSKQFREGRAMFLVDRSLQMMYRGGIYDHIGGGFSRYSTDERWLIPHFEKMLYDNALLADVYTNAWKYTNKSLFKDVATDILEYTLRDMTSSEGGFFSAEDADSEGKEGNFYTWTAEKLKQILGEKCYPLFAEFYGVQQEGNFEGKNVLYQPLSLEEFAVQKKLELLSLKEELAVDRKLVFEERDKRIHPLKDDKILTSWNGLMIHALASAGAAFGDARFTQAAVTAADFVRTYLWDRKELFRRYRDGDVLRGGNLEDYAYYIKGLITLFTSGQGAAYLELALRLTDVVKNKFKIDQGAFYQSPPEEENLILRKCVFADGAEPSGNAIHTENLLRLYLITGDLSYRDQAEDVLKSIKKFLDLYSAGYFYHTINLMRYHDSEAKLAVIALNDAAEHEEILRQIVSTTYAPHTEFIWLNQKDKALLKILPYLESHLPQEGLTTLYLCREGACREPITDINKMVETIKNI